MVLMMFQVDETLLCPVICSRLVYLPNMTLLLLKQSINLGSNTIER